MDLQGSASRLTKSSELTTEREGQAMRRPSRLSAWSYAGIFAALTATEIALALAGSSGLGRWLTGIEWLLIASLFGLVNATALIFTLASRASSSRRGGRLKLCVSGPPPTGGDPDSLRDRDLDR
jgi:hypothetical protein